MAIITLADEALLRAPALLTPRKQPTAGNVRLDKTHPFTRRMVGCWPMWQHTPTIVPDLCGNNDATVAGTTLSHVQTKYAPGGRGVIIPNDNTNSRLTLGSIPSTNPLNCSSTDEISIFGWGYIPNTPNNVFPRLIDKSNSGSGANGWALAIRWNGAAAPDDTLEFYVAGTGYNPGANALGASAADYAGKLGGLGVVAASGSQEYIWNDNIIGSTTASISIPGATTNASLLNWNHTTDRQWGDMPMFYISVWNRRLDATDLLDLSHDPYQIFIPA